MSFSTKHNKSQEKKDSWKTQKRTVAAWGENLHWIPPPLRKAPPPAPPPVTLVREAASSQHSRGAGVQDTLHFTLQGAGLAREATATSQQASSNLWSHLRQESACLTHRVISLTHFSCHPLLKTSPRSHHVLRLLLSHPSTPLNHSLSGGYGPYT